MFMNDSHAEQLVNSTAANGKPALVHHARNLGAWPRNDRPYKTRDEENRKEFPAEKADVKTQALTMWGSTLIPALVMTITYGDCAAVPASDRRSGSSYGTTMPVTRMPRIYKRDQLNPDTEQKKLMGLTYVEDTHTPEYTANSLGDIAARVLSL